jgi:hypothetical protein
MPELIWLYHRSARGIVTISRTAIPIALIGETLKETIA